VNTDNVNTTVEEKTTESSTENQSNPEKAFDDATDTLSYHGGAPREDQLSHNLTVAVGMGRRAPRWYNENMTVQQLLILLGRHDEGEKDGKSFMQCSLIGKRRRHAEVTSLCVMGVDVDCGVSFVDSVAKVQELKLLCAAYSTHSHGKTTTDIAAKKFAKWATANDVDPIANVETMKAYLVEHPKLVADVVESISAVKQEGSNYIVTHRPTDRFRLVFPLRSPYVLADFRGSRDDAEKHWKGKVRGLAKLLGLGEFIDASCLDPTRLFYLPRHAPGADNYQSHIFNGEFLSFDNLEVVASTRKGYVGSRAGVKKDRPASAGNVFADAARDMGAGDAPMLEFETVEGVHMPGWFKRNGWRFDIEGALYAHAEVRGTASGGGIVAECPYDEEHSNPGDETDEAFWVMNPTGSGDTFKASCRHDSCQGRTKTDFIAKMILDETLPAEVLTRGFWCDAVDGTIDDAVGVEIELKSLLAQAETITKQTLKGVIDGMLHRLARLDVGMNQRDVIIEKIAEKHGVKPATIMKRFAPMAESANKERRRVKRLNDAIEKVELGKKPSVCLQEAGHMPSVKTAYERLEALNVVEATYFEMAGQRVRLEKGPDGTVTSVEMNKDTLRAVLSDVIDWERPSGDSYVSASCDDKVASDVLVSPFLTFPHLERFADAPFFAKDGTLIKSPGYHKDSGVYLRPTPGFALPEILDDPTDDQIAEARKYIEENVFHDFPFEGDDGGSASRAHAWCLLLSASVREMIDGNTPCHLLTKPTPGTGATKLVEAITLLASGQKASIQTETPNRDEQRKELLSFLLGGETYHFTDNVNRRIEGSVLASILTSGFFMGRILGRSQNARIPVKATFIIAGNNPEVSDEISRRCLPILLDTGLDDPTKGRTFVHDDLEAWVAANRAKLVASVLTIVQGWVARGKPKWKGQRLASFESWSEVMGGILEVAGIEGFLGNLELVRDAANPEMDALKAFYGHWWDINKGESQKIGNPDNDIKGTEDWQAGESLVSLIERKGVGIRLHARDGAGKAHELSLFLAHRCKRPVTLPNGVRVVLRNKTDRKGIKEWFLEQLNAEAAAATAPEAEPPRSAKPTRGKPYRTFGRLDSTNAGETAIKLLNLIIAGGDMIDAADDLENRDADVPDWWERRPAA
jgi:hypothetical protein